MTPLDIFFIPGKFALYKLILPFFQVSAWQLDSGLGTVFSFFLALIFWSVLTNICMTIIKRQLGFEQRGR